MVMSPIIPSLECHIFGLLFNLKQRLEGWVLPASISPALPLLLPPLQLSMPLNLAFSKGVKREKLLLK